MKITSITILFFLFSVFEIIRTFMRIKRETLSIRSALVWLAMWGGIGFFSIFPGLLDSVMHLAQMKSRIFFIIIISLFIIFTLLFSFVHRLDKMERSIAKLVQENAMLGYKLKRISEKPEEEKCNTEEL